MARGDYIHRIRFEQPGQPIPDGDGGYTQGWTPLEPQTWFASIRPATARDLEIETAGTITASATHIIESDFHPGVTIHTRVVKLDNGRIFQVAGLANHADRDVTMSLFCQETL
jgi:head-tail adaptor